MCVCVVCVRCVYGVVCAFVLCECGVCVLWCVFMCVWFVWGLVQHCYVCYGFLLTCRAFQNCENFCVMCFVCVIICVFIANEKFFYTHTHFIPWTYTLKNAISINN